MRFLIIILALSISPVHVFSEQPEEKPETRIERLLMIKRNINWLESEIKSHGDQAEIAKLKEQLENTKTRFINTASELDIEEEGEEAEEKEQKDFLKEIQTIIEPLLEQFRKISERPRKIDALKTELEELEDRLSTFKDAEKRINLLIHNKASTPILNELKDAKASIINKYDEFLSRKEAIQHTLEQETKSNKSLLGSVTESIKQFLLTKGKNLLFAIIVFFGVLWLASILRKTVFKSHAVLAYIGSVKKAIDALYGIITVVLAIAGFVTTLYLLNDWVLVTISILFITALIWSSKQVLPKFINELRIMLNLGTVKEGERIVIDEIPWLVKHIGVYSVLVNEELESGQIKIPASELCKLHSRRIVPGEPWFPCKKGDWVLLDDGTYANVAIQTPEQVVLALPDNTRKIYPTRDFLKQKPQNFSNGFYLSTEIGLDYSMQKKITKNVLEIMLKGLTTRFEQRTGNGEIKNISVQFKSADASALTIIAIAECSGKVAPYKSRFTREINAALVDICNENNFTIPFNQLTVHLDK